MSSTTREPQPQSATASDTPHIPPANLTVEPLSHRDHVYPSSVFDARIDPNRRSTGDSSIRRRSSDRPSIIQIHSRESLPMPVSQPTQFPRAPHRHFGRGPSVSPSRTSSRSPSPTPQLPRLDIDVTNPHQVDRRDSPIHPPSVISHGHTQPSPPSFRGQDRRDSSTSVVVGIVNPSTDSLPAPPRILTDGPPLTEEPYTIDSPTDHLSVPSIDLREGLPQYSPTSSSSSVTSTLDPPAGRSLQLITPEQVPRYTKDVTVQVDSIIATVNRLRLWQTPRKHLLRNSAFDQDVSSTGHLEDCAHWVPATHPDGALYFFDQERRLFTDTDMFDPLLREEMEVFYQYIQKILPHDGVAIRLQSCDLVLDIFPTEDDQVNPDQFASGTLVLVSAGYPAFCVTK
ncbi:hypothetical protein EDB85DRAFT_1893507 [Lactarius pseudohatsudake]|nr:hypothetical protein EDB85DRAFT_1893507 [Lactarius pseudohatsudake]